MTVKEPSCLPGRKPHRERVATIAAMLARGRTGAICIDNTEEHLAFYLAELEKYPNLKVVHQGPLCAEIYVIKVEKF